MSKLICICGNEKYDYKKENNLYFSCNDCIIKDIVSVFFKGIIHNKILYNNYFHITYKSKKYEKLENDIVDMCLNLTIKNNNNDLKIKISKCFYEIFYFENDKKKEDNEFLESYIDITKLIKNYINNKKDTYCISCKKIINNRTTKNNLLSIPYCTKKGCFKKEIEKNGKIIILENNFRCTNLKCEQPKLQPLNNFNINENCLENQIIFHGRICKKCDTKKYSNKRTLIANKHNKKINEKTGTTNGSNNTKKYNINNSIPGINVLLKSMHTNNKTNKINLFENKFKNSELFIKLLINSNNNNKVLDLKDDFSLKNFNLCLKEKNKKIFDKYTIDHIVPKNLANKKIKYLFLLLSNNDYENITNVQDEIINIFVYYFNHYSNLKIIKKSENSAKKNIINDKYQNIIKANDILNKIFEDLNKNEKINKLLLNKIDEKKFKNILFNL